MSIKSDGKSVMYFDPSVQVGLVGGGFDWDFGMEGVINATDKGSAGQQVAGRFMRLVQRSQEESINWRITPNNVNDVWAHRIKMAQELLEPVIEKGPPTVLLDEPDAVLDWPTKLPLWQWVQREGCSGKVQFIVATNSVFGLWLMRHPGVNVIELKKGYRQECEAILKDAGFWASGDLLDKNI